MADTELVEAIQELTKAVKRLSDLLPYCDYCGSIKICESTHIRFR